MRTSTLVAVGLLAAAAPLTAQQPVPQERVHVVRRGETLWDIARQYLSDPFLWPEIFRINTARVGDPAVIYPNQRLLLPAGAVAAGPSARGDRTVFFPVEQDRESRIFDLARENAPAVTVGDFYRASLLVHSGEVQAIGRVMGPISPTIVPIETAPQIQPYDRVNVTLAAPGNVKVGDRFHFLRRGAIIPPFGQVYVSTGIGTVAALEGTTATVVVTRLYDRIDLGDLATLAEPFTLRAGVAPREAAGGLDGRVVGFATNHVVRAIEEMAFLDVGRTQGLKEGDEFEAYIPAAQTPAGYVPAVAVSRLQVVRVTDRTATARVMSLDQPALQIGLPVRRIAQMP